MKKNSIRVLLIEDNEEDVLIIKSMLSEINPELYQLDWAATLCEGKIKLQEQEPDIILLDVSLPDSNGFEGVEVLQSLKPAIPIIILTGYSDRAGASVAIQKGAEDYLNKGHISVALLERTVQYSIERKKVKSELALANTALQDLVGRDPLTGALNRWGFQEVLGKIFALRERAGLNLQAILLDLDDLKILNEKYGYGIGDIALKEVSKAIKNVARASDYVARIGGDEFIVLLTNTRSEEAFLVAEKLRAAVSENLFFADAGKPVRVTCSLGISAVEDGCEILEGLIEVLESSLRRSKSLGKNRITIQEDSGLRNIPSALEVQGGAKPVLKTEDFYAVYQPIFELIGKKEIAYEMLSRIHSDSFNNIVDLFLLARQHNLITWVDFQCFKTCLRTATKLPSDSIIHINLLPSTLLALHADRLKEEAEKFFKNHKLCIELSEQQIVSEPSHLLSEVNQFKKSGIQIAIDDVGFGYSSLESLVILEPHVVKIDIKCIKGIATDITKQSQFRRLVRVIETCEAQYMVEGIENEEDYNFLIQAGARYGQGYLLARPRPV